VISFDNEYYSTDVFEGVFAGEMRAHLAYVNELHCINLYWIG
jgi:hypothetical protein